MVKQKLSKKRWTIIAIISVVLLAIASILFLDFNKSLALEKLPDTMRLEGIEWVNEEQVFFNFRAGISPQPIDGLPTDDPIYFTNTHFADSYQYAQTAGGGTWTQSQRLFWRKDSTEDWKEIQLTEKDVYPSYFVSKSGRQYLAAIGGLIAEDRYLYLIDIEQGTLKKQFKASDIVISPDTTKILYDNHKLSSLTGFHTIGVFDLENGTRTKITNLTEASPGSGRGFNFKWSSDSNLVEIEGTSGDNPRGFRYIYEHDTKKLFDA